MLLKLLRFDYHSQPEGGYGMSACYILNSAWVSLLMLNLMARSSVCQLILQPPCTSSYSPQLTAAMPVTILLCWGLLCTASSCTAWHNIACTTRAARFSDNTATGAAYLLCYLKAAPARYLPAKQCHQHSEFAEEAPASQGCKRNADEMTQVWRL